MRFWFYILLLFNCYWLSGQKSDTIENPVFLLALNIQPSIGSSAFGNEFVGYREFKISPRFVLNPGLTALIKAHRNWYLNLNVSYTELGYKETIINSGNNKEETRRIIHKDHYITSGFAAQYRLRKIYFRLGMNAARFINSKKIEDGKINPYGSSGGNGSSSYSAVNGYNSQVGNSEWDKWLFGIMGGIGINLKLNNKLYFVPEVFISTFKPVNTLVFWNNLYYNTGPGEGYYLTGINLSLFYKLK